MFTKFFFRSINSSRLAGLCLLFVSVGLLPRSFGQITNLATTIQFSAAIYTVPENSGSFIVAVTRSGDTSNEDLVEYLVTDGTAVRGVDYFAASNGFLDFLPGETVQFFAINLIDNGVINSTKTVNLSLGSVISGFASLGTPSRAVLQITDDESNPTAGLAGQLQFSTSRYTFMKSEETPDVDDDWDEEFPGAVLTIVRTGGARGKVMVDWATTTNGIPALPAVDGRDYFQDSGTVTLVDYQMSTNIYIFFPVPVYSRIFDTNQFTNSNFDFSQFLDRNFRVELSNPRAAPEEDPNIIAPTLGAIPTADVLIANNDPFLGFSFRKAQVSFHEGRKFMHLWVNRSPPYGEGVSVHYRVNQRDKRCDAPLDNDWNTFALSPGSDYATPFVDYLPPGSDRGRPPLSRRRTCLNGEWGISRPKKLLFPLSMIKKWNSMKI